MSFQIVLFVHLFCGELVLFIDAFVSSNRLFAGKIIWTQNHHVLNKLDMLKLHTEHAQMQK